MVYDEALAERVAAAVADTQPEIAIDERKMFGGWCVMLRGNMAVGVIGDDLIVRVGPDAQADALGRPGAREFDFTGRPMKSWVTVDGAALSTAPRLAAWSERGVSYALSLPPGGSAERKRSRPRPRNGAR